MVAALRREERAIEAGASTNAPAAGFLRAEQVTKRFGRAPAVDGVSLDVGRGEFVSILGPSGCGKTTLLRLIAGLETADDGRILLDGRDITRAAPGERHCGIVFQSYALFPNLTAARNVAYGLRGLSRGERDARVRQWLEWVGLSDYGARRPSQLSGGQQQRVALARALAPEPSVLLLDEPLSALDAKVRHTLRTQIRDIQRRLGITTIMVTHDQLEAMTMAERIVVMRDGRILQVGTPSELYHRPADPFVADFLGSMNFMKGRIAAADVVDCGGLKLRVEQKLPGTAGDEVVVAIRPEDIHPGDAEGVNGVQVRLRDREFRGSHYRMSVEIEGADRRDGPVMLEIEHQGREADLLGTEMGASLGVRLPPDRLIAFAPSVK